MTKIVLNYLKVKTLHFKIFAFHTFPQLKIIFMREICVHIFIEKWIWGWY